MSAADDLALIDQQEAALRFPSFNTLTAWELGNLLRTALLERNAAATIEIELAGQLLFACTTPGATPGQADWIRRKRNVVKRFARSTYAIGRILERDGLTLEARHGLELKDFAAHGGGFPIHIEGTGIVGTVVVSGLPERADHNLVVNTLAQQLGITVPVLD